MFRCQFAIQDLLIIPHRKKKHKKEKKSNCQIHVKKTRFDLLFFLPPTCTFLWTPEKSVFF